MHTIHRALGHAAALLFAMAGISCREPAVPSGLGRVAPTHAALAFSSVLPESSGEPVIPLRAARVRLFRLPGELPERAVLDTVVPFRETDQDLALTLGIVVTMVSERFGLELSLVDDQQQVVYQARDTVVAYTTGQSPPGKQIALRYVGADTAVTRIALATDEGVIAVGEATPLRVSAFLRDGRSTSARFGYAVHGTSAITVDDAAVLRATAPVSPGKAWVVARIATGLADSITVEAIEPTASLELSATTAQVDVGASVTLGAIARDRTGTVLEDRRAIWTSSDESVATVTEGVVTGRARGRAVITARSGHVRADATINVGPAVAARIVISPHALSLLQGDAFRPGVSIIDGTGAAQVGRAVDWRSLDPSIASVDGTGLIRALSGGRTSIVATIDLVSDTITIVSRTPVTLAITRTGTTFDSRGEIAAFVVSSYDQFGALIGNPSAQWSVTPGATLLGVSGPSTQLVLVENAKVVLSAEARGLRADLPVAAAAVAPPPATPVAPVTPPVIPTPPNPPTPPTTPPPPPKRG